MDWQNTGWAGHELAGGAPVGSRTDCGLDVPATDRTWTPRSELELIGDQLAGITGWHRWARQQELDDAPAAAGSREQRLDASRRRHARQVERDALHERTQEHLRVSVHQLASRIRPRALVVHRHSWWAERVADRLTDRGVNVLAVLQDGARAAGSAVAEQPDLLLLQHPLPTLPAIGLLGRARHLSPTTVTGVQLAHAEDTAAFLHAGAHVFSRRVPPADVADALLTGLLQSTGPTVTL